MKSKRFLLLTGIFILFAFNVQAQAKADRILGYYYIIEPDTKEPSQIQIYKTAQGKYEGKVIWVKNPDRKNMVGYVFLTGFAYDAKEDEWSGGKMYNPANDNSYKAYMKFESDNKLKVRGYVGFSLLGKSMYWDKETTPRK